MRRRGLGRPGLRLVCVVWVLLSITLSAHALPRATPDVRVGPTPAWVERVEIPTRKDPEQQNGQSLLLLDFQRRAVGAERVRFVRGAVRVTSQVGVRDAAQRKFHFTPPFERLVVHRLEIQRGVATISHLDPRNIQVLQREAGLEDSVYDGARTALAVIPDVRIGDVIVYEYSVIGQNSVLGGHIMEDWQLALPIAVGRLDYRMISDRALSVRSATNVMEPESHTVGGLNEYRWKGEDLAAVALEEHMPDGYEPTPWAELSDYGSWREVAEWGSHLFALPTEPGPRVRALAAEIRAQTDDRDRQALAVLRRVQDDVRYFSLAFAESSHRPAPPEKVLERRFGDCKDKALLMVAVLRALGIPADPALVSTSDGALLAERLPSAKLFDHVIVRVGGPTSRVWLDATRLYQRGRFQDVLPEGFHYALVLATGTTDLTPVTELTDERPGVRATLAVGVKSFGGPVSLDVRVTYTGYRAESFRALKASGSHDELNDAAAEEVMRAFPRARRTSDAIVADDEATNALTIDQSFSLDSAWVNEGGVDVLALSPPWIDGELPGAPMDRRHPIALEHPLLVVQDFEITTPVPLKAEDESQSVSPGPFSFAYRATKLPGKLHVHYELATYAERVEVSDLPRYRDAQASVARTLEYRITHNSALDRDARSPLWLAALGVFWTFGMVALVLVIQHRRPYFAMRRVPYEPALAGRRSWLALLGFGVSVAPLRTLYNAAQVLPAYGRLRWAQLTTVGSAAYHPLYAPLLTVELLANITLIIGVSYFAYLYWAGHRSFPLVFASMQAFSVLFIFGDELAASAIPAAAAQAASEATALGALAPGLIWGSYVLLSKRVKATFLPSPEERRKELRAAKRAARRARKANQA